MPSNSTYYPTSMKNLPPVVREKAIEIANALLEEGMEEGKAIRIAIAKARNGRAATRLKARMAPGARRISVPGRIKRRSEGA